MLTISRTRLLTGAAALALTASLGATPGFAETATDTMTISAQVNQSCTVTSDGDIDFGPIEPGVKATSASGFVVNCTFGGDVSVEVGNGNNHDGTFRRMANGGDDLLRYQLWQSDAEQNQWDGPESVTVTSGDTPFDVHGVIPGTFSDSASVGNYSDTVTISVTF